MIEGIILETVVTDCQKNLFDRFWIFITEIVNKNIPKFQSSFCIVTFW